MPEPSMRTDFVVWKHTRSPNHNLIEPIRNITIDQALNTVQELMKSPDAISGNTYRLTISLADDNEYYFEWRFNLGITTPTHDQVQETLSDQNPHLLVAKAVDKMWQDGLGLRKGRSNLSKGNRP
jgi:hypothetical protein